MSQRMMWRRRDQSPTHGTFESSISTEENRTVSNDYGSYQHQPRYNNRNDYPRRNRSRGRGRGRGRYNGSRNNNYRGRDNRYPPNRRHDNTYQTRNRPRNDRRYRGRQQQNWRARRDISPPSHSFERSSPPARGRDDIYSNNRDTRDEWSEEHFSERYDRREDRHEERRSDLMLSHDEIAEREQEFKEYLKESRETRETRSTGQSGHTLRPARLRPARPNNTANSRESDHYNAPMPESSKFHRGSYQERARPNSSSWSKRSKRMLEQIMAGTYECMICQMTVGRKGRIWTCAKCYTIFHLTCCNKWARTSEMKQAEAEQRALTSDDRITSLKCPACNHVNSDFKMNYYFCHCKKQTNPRPDNYLNIPHSCGEMCNKPRGVGCPHPCMNVCHPGPCDPCPLPAKETTHCACGKMEYRLKCGEVERNKRVCQERCEKLLSCGNHRCQNQCHNGPCDPCTETNQAICFCGKERRDLACGEGRSVVLEDGSSALSFSCEQICEKKLDCGNHTCRLKCHSGSCSGCPRKVVRPALCACGKSKFKKFSRESCLDKLPTCKQKCDRMLSCGKHLCKRKCHDSDCPPCTVPVKKKCRCGKETKTVKCSEYELRCRAIVEEKERIGQVLFDVNDWIQCRKRCNRILSCGVHSCKVTCCKGRTLSNAQFDGHRCRVVCNKPLQCGRHTCGRSCHSGHCPPCGVTYRDGIQCACGAEFIPGPLLCGSAKLPKCKVECPKILNCGHYCRSLCHHGNCPPCKVLVDKRCESHGKFVHNIPCLTKKVSCGRICGKTLPCGTHRCLRSCHTGKCVTDEKKEELKSGCSQSCGKKLPCGHVCVVKCHPSATCDANRCKQPIVVQCVCGARAEQQQCKGRKETDIRAISCSEICEIAERNKRFREAFNIVPADERKDSNSDRRIPYSSNLMERAIFFLGGNPKKSEELQDISFITGLERLLQDFLEDGSPNLSHFAKRYPHVKLYGGDRVIHLWNMEREERFIVFSMLSQYHMSGESIDDYDERVHIAVTKNSRSCVPDMLLSQALMEYSTNRDHIKTLESCPPECMIVIDNTAVSSNKINDRLTAWFGDYRIWRNENNQTFIVFTTEELRNSALTEVSRFGGRKAKAKDSVPASVAKKKKDAKRRAKQKQQKAKQKTKGSKQNAQGWTTVGTSDSSSDVLHQERLPGVVVTNRFRS